MPRVFLYIPLCTKRLDKNEKLPVGQAGVLTVGHYPVSSLRLFWLWTVIWLERPFLTGNVFPQAGQQCQTDLQEAVLSYISFGFFFLEYYSSQSKWGRRRWCLFTISYNTAVSGCSGLVAPQVLTALYLICIYWAYLQHRLSPGLLWYHTFLSMVTNLHLPYVCHYCLHACGTLILLFPTSQIKKKKSPAKFILFIVTQYFGPTFQGRKETTNENIYERGHSWSHLSSQKQTNKHCPNARQMIITFLTPARLSGLPNGFKWEKQKDEELRTRGCCLIYLFIFLISSAES